MSSWVKLTDSLTSTDNYNSSIPWGSRYTTTWDNSKMTIQGMTAYTKGSDGDWHPYSNYGEKYLWLLPPIKDCGEEEDRLRYDDWSIQYELLESELYYKPIFSQDLEIESPEPEDHYIKKPNQWTLKWEYAQEKVIKYLEAELAYIKDLYAKAEAKKNDLQVKILQETASEDGDLAVTLARLELPRVEEIFKHCQETLKRVEISLNYCKDSIGPLPDGLIEV